MDLVRGDERDVAPDPRTHELVRKRPVGVQRRVGLRDRVAVLVFGPEVLDLGRHPAVDDLAVRRLDKAEAVDDAVRAEARDEANVGTLGRLDRAEPPVVGVVDVADLEARALARQAARPKGRHAALVRQFGQRVRLVHELRQLVGAEERVDHARHCPRVDEVLRGELIRIAEVHSLLDRARHAGEPERELLPELLADGPHAAVAEVVDVVHLALAVLQLDELGDDRDDVLLAQRQRRDALVEPEPPVHAVAADVAQVVALVREEEPVEEGARRLDVGRLGPAELLVEVRERLGGRVRRVLLERVEQRRHVELLLLRVVVVGRFASQDDRLDTSRLERVVVLLGERVLGGQHDFALGRFAENLARVLVDHLVFDLDGQRRREHAADELLEGALVRDGLLVREVKEGRDLGVGRVPERAKEARDGNLLFAVDVGPHDVRHVGRELDPRAPEGDDAGRVEVRPVGVNRLVEENARAAVQLAHDDALGPVHDERAFLGHHREVAEVDVLLDGLLRLVLVFVFLSAQAQLGLERESVREPLGKAFLDGVLGGFERVVEVLEGVALPGVRDREVLLEDGLEALARVALLGHEVLLEKVRVGAKLNLEEVRKFEDGRDARERLARRLAARARTGRIRRSLRRRAGGCAQDVPLGW